MLKIGASLGLTTDAGLSQKLHELEHKDAVEQLFIPESDAGRKRFRARTDKGTECAITLDREQTLIDGSVLFIDENSAVVVRIGAPRTLRLRPKDRAGALQLGWSAGHLHWRVKFEGDDILVLMDQDVEDYTSRIDALLSSGSVERIV